jgi:hypothetical protein
MRREKAVGFVAALSKAQLVQILVAKGDAMDALRNHRLHLVLDPVLPADLLQPKPLLQKNFR